MGATIAGATLEQVAEAAHVYDRRDLRRIFGQLGAQLWPAADVVLIARTSSGARVSGYTAESGKETVLSNREREILALLADGLVNKQIAARLGISTNTVKTHLELLFDKLGVATRAEAVATGVKRGLLLL